MTKHRSVPMHLTMPAPNKRSRHDATTSSAAVGIELTDEIMDRLHLALSDQAAGAALQDLRECDPAAYAAHDLKERGYSLQASVQKLGRSRSSVYGDRKRATLFLGINASPDLAGMSYEDRAAHYLTTESRAMHVFLLVHKQWRIPAIAEHLGKSESTVKRDYAKMVKLLGPEQPNVLWKFDEVMVPQG